jgi:Nucleotidyltransferase domain
VTASTLASADEVGRLLDRFASGVSRVLPLVALWAHGSLALGDFQPGRSDLDLVALVDAAITDAQRRDLQHVHETLIRHVPLADELHCAYLARSDLADAGQSHLTWAHGELLRRVLSPVSRRELCLGGLCLLGPAPATVVPAVTDQDLADYIRGNLRDYWYPATDRPELWLRDIWVDLGTCTLARAAVTLQGGRLITKREALEVLASWGAPAGVVRDIYQRRYETAQPISEQWRARRGFLARTYVRAGIERVLGGDQNQALTPSATSSGLRSISASPQMRSK